MCVSVSDAEHLKRDWTSIQRILTDIFCHDEISSAEILLTNKIHLFTLK